MSRFELLFGLAIVGLLHESFYFLTFGETRLTFSLFLVLLLSFKSPPLFHSVFVFFFFFVLDALLSSLGAVSTMFPSGGGIKGKQNLGKDGIR